MTLIVFDWDGTLNDSWVIFDRAAREHCANTNIYLPSETELRYSFGNTNWDGLEQWGNENDVKENSWVQRQKIYDIFHELIREPKNNIIFPGLEGVFQECINADHTVAIATSRPRLNLVEALEFFGWKDLVTQYVTVDCAHENNLEDKPAPDMLNWVIAECGFTNEQTIMIGDTAMDIKMAKAANVTNIGVTWGMAGLDGMRALVPDVISSSPTQLFTDIRKTVSNL